MSLAQIDSIVEGHRVLFVHAHPDDEVLGTGVLLAHLADTGVPAAVVTCTRGERGEIVPGAIADGADVTTARLAEIRERECAAALEVVAEGRVAHHWLGTPPARAAGKEPRVYRDSGMRWVTPTQAGPAEDADERSFVAGGVDEQVADLAALVRDVHATLLVSYDENGTYGHPDHVRAHEIARRTAAELGLPFAEADGRGQDDGDVAVADFPQYEDRIRRSLAHYRTQLTVHEDHVEHVGGQRTPLPLTARLRLRF